MVHRYKNVGRSFFRVVTIHAFNRQTDRLLQDRAAKSNTCIGLCVLVYVFNSFVVDVCVCIGF